MICKFDVVSFVPFNHVSFFLIDLVVYQVSWFCLFPLKDTLGDLLLLGFLPGLGYVPKALHFVYNGSY